VSKTSVLTSYSPAAADRIAAVREFNRFYTGLLGLLREGLLDTPYSLTEARVIFELARTDYTEVADFRRTLNIDAGYLSRLLARFEADGLIVRRRSPSDGRRQVIGLTGPGRAAFQLLDRSSAAQVGALLAARPEPDQQRLTEAMGCIQQILTGVGRRPTVRLRQPGPGDLGWVVQEHGAQYAAEYGWDATFEALVARIVAGYASDHDPQRERAWIAEADGQRAGCVFCVRRDEVTAQLRLLLVTPAARGRGIGHRLVAECISFARASGYRELVLWTNDVLTAARHIYQRAGFELVAQERHHSFGTDLVGQTWRLRTG
jgi:DNA-binding MarR family transcriptional regulator/N-acetylglutamate synthase-like GNAT family acetyltransferase